MVYTHRGWSQAQGDRRRCDRVLRWPTASRRRRWHAAYRPRRSQPVDPPSECPTPAGGGGGGDPPMVFVAVKGCVCMHYTSTRLNDLYTQLPQKNINIEMYYVEVFWGSTHVLSLPSLTPHLPDV